MKKYAVLALLISTFFSFFTPSFATNYTNPGSGQAYNLYNGDTLRITGGTYHGGINVFTNGAVIIVSAGATFKPDYINTPSGKIINYGLSQFSSLGTQSGFSFENNSRLTVSGDLSLYDGSGQTWLNNAFSTITVGGSFSMSNATLTNKATISVANNFSLYSVNSVVTNTGLISVGNSFSMSNGVLTNKNIIRTKDFNAWGGQVINEGELSPSGAVTFNNGTNYTNKCLLVTSAGFTNYGNFTNNGLLWVGRSGTAADHFYNSGTFTNSADAVVRTIKLTNYNVLNGGGGYYITGESYTSGTVGRSGSTTDSIKIYDLTRTNSGSLFDVQYGTVYANAVYRPFAQPDTSKMNYSGCSSFFKNNQTSLLPVEWLSFSAKLFQDRVELNWSAQYEAGMSFQVERSEDNLHFEAIGKIASNAGKTYSFTDAVLSKANTVYYRIKATGAVDGLEKYTETRSVKLNTTLSALASVVPNPVKSSASIQYTAQANTQVLVRVINVSGQQMLSKTYSAVKGANSLSLSEAAQLKAGNYFMEVIADGNLAATTRFVKD